MGETWRLFVAIPIGEALRASLSASVDTWRGRPDLEGLRWTEPEGWHLTLAFLGATEPTAVDGLARSIASAAATAAPMTLPAGGVGGFPSPGRARVAWYGVGDAGRLAQLASSVRSSLRMDPDERFRPHLTLARARREPVDLRRWVAEADAPDAELRVEHVELMRSHLGRGPARYEVLATAPMGGAVHA